MTDTFNVEPVMIRTDHQMLVSIAQLLTELLAETKRGNSIARDGAVSSVVVKYTAKGDPAPEIKVYAGSEPPVVEAIEAYGRAVLWMQAAKNAGWEETVDVLHKEFVNA